MKKLISNLAMWLSFIWLAFGIHHYLKIDVRNVWYGIPYVFSWCALGLILIAKTVEDLDTL